jgi:uncharacterized protein (DUF433 family)
MTASRSSNGTSTLHYGIFPERLFARTEHIGYVGIMKSDDLIVVDPEILGGTPVFKNTRVPIKTLFDYLEQNYTLEEFLACFPSVTREMACRVLERSETALLSKP